MKGDGRGPLRRCFCNFGGEARSLHLYRLPGEAGAAEVTKG